MNQDFQSPSAPATAPLALDRKVSVLDAFAFVFRERDVVSTLAFAALLQFIPVVGSLAFCGWLAEVQQRLAAHHPEPIPKFSFDDFGSYLERGLVSFVGRMIVASVIAVPAVFVGVFLSVGWVAAASTSAARRAPFTFDPSLWPVIAAVAACSVVLGVLLSVVVTSVRTLAELSEDYRVAFSPQKNLAYLAKVGTAILWHELVFSLLAFAAMLAGLLFCVVGVYVAAQVVQFAAAHLRFQLYNEYLLRSGEPLPVKPLGLLTSEQKAAYYRANPAGPTFRGPRA